MSPSIISIAEPESNVGTFHMLLHTIWKTCGFNRMSQLTMQPIKLIGKAMSGFGLFYGASDVTCLYKLTSDD